MLRYFALLMIVSSSLIFALDNGLARTPPMGWMSWERFRCITDCQKFPKECISENLYREMADRLAEDGYLKAGYEYINIDDCWSAMERDKDGNLQADPIRFPSGIKALSDYIHSKGLKFGIYADYGTKTCGGYPGTTLTDMEKDAKLFADWGVDSLKLDGCYSDPDTMDFAYPKMGKILNDTGRPILYSCSWPAYQKDDVRNYASMAEHCNLWRNFDDIEDTWESVLSIIEYYGSKQDQFAKFAGPGNWNDPDMIIVGNFGLTSTQAYTQMAFWAMFSAPLLMSNDLRDIDQESRSLLLDKDLIAINQDPLGKQAMRVWKKKDDLGIETSLWIKPLSGKRFAFLVFNKAKTGSIGYSLDFEINLEKELGISDAVIHSLKDGSLHEYHGGNFKIEKVRPDSVQVFIVENKHMNGQ